MMDFLMIVSAVCYLLGAGACLAYLAKPLDRRHRIGIGFLIAGLLAHTALLGRHFLAAGHLPVYNLHHTLSIAAWCLAVVYLVCQFRFDIKVLGSFAVPVIGVLMAVAWTLPDQPMADPKVLKSFWLVLHVVSVFLGEAALALACGAGALYLLQERAIKNKRRGFFFKRLPSLDRLDAVGYATIAAGFTLLTVGLITGAVYAQLVWGRFWSWDPKEVWAGITWLIYAGLLHQRLTVGWRGHRAAMMAIVGFCAVVFTFLGVNLLMKGHHGVFTRF
jgi:cytochrome c-type biogenesis protein CcsB